MNQGIWVAVREYLLSIAILLCATNAFAEQGVTTVATPVISPFAGIYTTDLSVTIKDKTAGATPCANVT